MPTSNKTSEKWEFQKNLEFKQTAQYGALWPRLRCPNNIKLGDVLGGVHTVPVSDQPKALVGEDEELIYPILRVRRKYVSGPVKLLLGTSLQSS